MKGSQSIDFLFEMCFYLLSLDTAPYKATASFQKDVEPVMFPLFSKFAACGETPDEYNGWMLYDAEDKNFFPEFKVNN